MNYCGELQHEGAFLASIKYLPKKSDPPSNSQARAIIRYVFTRVVVFFSFSTCMSCTKWHIEKGCDDLSSLPSSRRTSSQNYDVSITIDEPNDENLLPLVIKQAYLSSIQTFKPTSHPRVCSINRILIEWRDFLFS